MSRLLDPRRVMTLALGVALSISTAAAERPRTPAEVELRRAEIAQRLVVLSEEEARLQAELAEGRAETVLDIEKSGERLKAIAAERYALAVEARDLAVIVTRTATGPLTRADPPGLPSAQVAGGTSQVTSGNAFNPAISVIPDALYYYDNEPPVAAERPPRGFSLREVELAFSGAVDPYFDVWAIFAIGDGEIDTEEVYVQTRRFLPGAQVRFGQFFSGIGYLNRQHPHQWDFVDQALPYAGLFGETLSEVGLQVTWLPALPFYTQFGFEALQGDNVFIANQLSDEFPDRVEDTPGPRLFTGFVKLSPDLGYENTLQAGVSFGRSRSHQEELTTDTGTEILDGTAWFVGTDLVWRYDSPSQYGEGDLKVQGEYVFRSKAFDAVSDRTERQDGLYAQAVYGIAPRWTVAGRFDAFGLVNEIETTFGTIHADASTRYAANVTFNPTEFSRLRLQYNYGRVPNGEGDDTTASAHQVYVQFQMSLGVHGAHAF